MGAGDAWKGEPEHPLEKISEAMEELSARVDAQTLAAQADELGATSVELSILGTVIGAWVDRQSPRDPRAIAMFLTRMTHHIVRLVDEAGASGGLPPGAEVS